MAKEFGEREVFYDALGAALNAWQGVEAESYLFFEAMLKGAPKKIPSVVFHHIKSFESKIGLMDQTAYFVLPKPLATDWKALKKRLDTQAKVRNKMAHFRLQRTVTNGRRQFSLAPSFFDETASIKDQRKKPEQTLTHDRLRKAETDFYALRDDLAAFTRRFKEAATIAK